MVRDAFPHRQLRLLRALENRPLELPSWLTAHDLGVETNCTREAARDCLERMRARYEVSRRPGEGKEYKYRISRKGLKRLNLLKDGAANRAKRRKA